MTTALSSAVNKNRLSSEVLVRNSIFWIPALASVLYVSLGSPGLPDKYRWDSAVIQQASSGTREVDSAYKFIANLYSALSLSNEPWLSAIVSLIPFLALQAYIYFRFAPDNVTLNIALFMISLDVLGAVYFGQMTKELFMLILPISFLISLKFQRFAKSSIVVPALVVATQMRTYWLIVILLLATSYGLSLRAKKIKALHLVTLCAAAFYVLPILFFYSQNYQLEEIRLGLNILRADSEMAQTAIFAPFDFQKPHLQLLNLLWILGCFIVPIPLLLTSQVAHLIFAAFIIYLSFVTISTIRFWNSNRADTYKILSSHLLISYLLTQALFEPDFGSFLRHLAPLLLFALFLFLTKEKSKLALDK